MSNSCDAGPRIRNGKAPERSNFIHTCNLLSQFIKGKATIRDLNLGITSQSEIAGIFLRDLLYLWNFRTYSPGCCKLNLEICGLNIIFLGSVIRVRFVGIFNWRKIEYKKF